ncbi:MAG TPA: selenocysteine-specific translation elongation factor [Actinomycetales bacterium]|nr:selenocysteine-specific translation elongation factor [Actinomycetales bacterium]
MHVVATAGHVDHGKSTLVAALTGTDPDRYAEEKRRGLTIDLGFAWTEIDGEQVAFVDVPGHERFVTTMLAGVGSVPAVLFVVAADEGWMPQTQEHLEALDGLGVERGLLVISRSDLGDADLATFEAREHLSGTTLATMTSVAVSAVTGQGMDELRREIARLVGALSPARSDAPVRLWVDRVFTMRGAGTVVTGTLSAGSIRAGDRLALGDGRVVTVRALQSLGRTVDAATAVSRVALNLRGITTDDVSRGDALTTPGTCTVTGLVDVRMRRQVAVPGESVLHIGSAHVPVHVRPLGEGRHARLRLASPLPLRLGDVGLLRDPGRGQVVGGFTVLDLDPPALQRRGDAGRRASELSDLGDAASAAEELSRRRVVERSGLLRMGFERAEVDALGDAVPSGKGWLVAPAHAEELVARLEELVSRHAQSEPLSPGLPTETARQRLGLPAVELLEVLVRPPLRLEAGVVVDGRRKDGAALPPSVASSVHALLEQLEKAPYVAPEANRLQELGLGKRELAAAVRAGALVRIGEAIYLSPEAVRDAVQPLRRLSQPFTMSDARQAWETSRRVAIPLLQHLDSLGMTERLSDDRRRVV